MTSDLIEEEEDAFPGIFCPTCGSDMEWIDCDQCGGEGGRDGEQLMEEDPLWYQPGDWERCEQCDGKGEWYECYTCKAATAREDTTS